MNKTKQICITALVIALYVAFSMMVKIPVVGHISLDLGYIVFAVYAYRYGWITGTIVGVAGCTLVSMLASGWFPIGWILGQFLIGTLCGNAYTADDDTKAMIWNIAITIFSVLIGIAGVKTAVECLVYEIPLAVKLPKNTTAAVMDCVVMSVGVVLARYIDKVRPGGGGDPQW